MEKACRTSEGNQEAGFIHSRAASSQVRAGGGGSHSRHARGRIFRHKMILHNLFGISVANT